MGIYQVVAKQTWIGQQVRNVFYYTSTSPLTEARRQEMVDKIRVNWASFNTAAGLCTLWSLDGMYVRDVASGGIPGVDLSFTSGVLVGGVAADPLAAQVGLLVIGRSGTVVPNQVRSYLAGFTEGNMGSAGLFATATVEDAFDWAVDMDVMGLTGDTVNRVSAQWTTGEDPYVVATNELVTYAAKENPVTQKRRRIGRGA